MNTRFTVPDDPLALRMENDLLLLEVEHLRGRWGSGDAVVDSAELEALRTDLARAERDLATEQARVRELASSRSDLRWLLQRLDGSVAGPLLRRFSGFRTLVDRWLES